MPFIDKEQTEYVVGALSDKDLRRFTRRREDYWAGYNLVAFFGTLGLAIALFVCLALTTHPVNRWVALGGFLAVCAVAVSVGAVLGIPGERRKYRKRAIHEGRLILSTSDTFQLVMTPAVKRGLSVDDDLRSAVDKFFVTHQASYMQDQRLLWSVYALFHVRDEKMVADETLEAIADQCYDKNLFRRHVRDFYSVRCAELIKEERESRDSHRDEAMAANRRIDQLNERLTSSWYYENS